jgi:hypothetical protein
MKKTIALTIALVANCAYAAKFENHSSYTLDIMDKDGNTVSLAPKELYHYGEAHKGSPFTITSPGIPDQILTLDFKKINLGPRSKVYLAVQESCPAKTKQGFWAWWTSNKEITPASPTRITATLDAKFTQYTSHAKDLSTP